MKTVILCGGFGTRIRDVADDIPKPMIPIGNRPILWHIMKYYSTYGFRDFVICLGYRGESIKRYFLDYEAFSRDVTVNLGGEKPIRFHTQNDEADWEVTLADTGLKSMTGSRISRIRKYIGDDTDFMLTYGDGLGDVNLPELIAYHKSHGKILTVTGVYPPGRFGELETNGEGLATSFAEKPQVSGGMISGGFFICKRELFEYVGDQEDLIFERDTMNELVKRKEMMVYKHSGFWQPVDTYREYKLLNDLYDRNEAPWMVWK